MSPIRLAALAAVCAALTAPAHAEERPLTAQQERMKSCNAEAGDKQMKGEERRQFMSQCLKSGGDGKMTAQQKKMGTCNRAASDRKLKGDERRAYMKDCLAKHEGTSGAAVGR